MSKQRTAKEALSVEILLPVRTHKCCERVSAPGGWGCNQCTRWAVVQDGAVADQAIADATARKYCRQHSPAKDLKRREERSQRWSKESTQDSLKLYGPRFYRLLLRLAAEGNQLAAAEVAAQKNRSGDPRLSPITDEELTR